MPDWSYHPLQKLLLNRLKPESSRAFIHHSMSAIASVPGGRALIGFLGHMKPAEALEKQVTAAKFPAPVGLSSLIDPQLSGLKAFQELGFGFIEIGPIVLSEPEEQLSPIRRNGRILFADHQEKVPLKLALKKLTRLNSRLPIFAHIDPDVTEKEWRLIVHHLTPYADAFIGTSEQIFLYDEQAVRPFYVSVSAEEINKKESEIAILIAHSNVSGIVLQAPRQVDHDYWHEANQANEMLAEAVAQAKAAYPHLAVITSGGTESPEDAMRLHRAGADLLMLTSGYIHSGPGLPKRIHERLYDEKMKPVIQQWHWSFLFGLSILIAGMIALYFAFTSIILPYDESFIGLTKAELLQINPQILSFMAHDRMALAGTMISGAILYIQLARHGIKNGLHWAKIAFHTAAITGFLGILLFIGYGYFDWLHGLFWLILVPIYCLSFKEGKKALASPCSKHETNDRAWKRGVYGQLMFVILGAFITIGGIVISAIGVSRVFVATDLSFLCMSPEMLDQISNRLIPVIAHDRAGFGSSLVSVGLLVLMISLWGFRKGESWIWNTLAIGALPAFLAGIGTHFYIGYTNLIHLLPVYLLVLLYVTGLVLSYPFLKKERF